MSIQPSVDLNMSSSNVVFYKEKTPLWLCNDINFIKDFLLGGRERLLFYVEWILLDFLNANTNNI